ncbi:MAG: hypothetical protein Q8T11_11180 [Elusimicrobiota bacterium]|nr:hypothetical protein [Elusimicrobiota bacterium]
MKRLVTFAGSFSWAAAAAAILAAPLQAQTRSVSLRLSPGINPPSGPALIASSFFAHPLSALPTLPVLSALAAPALAAAPMPAPAAAPAAPLPDARGTLDALARSAAPGPSLAPGLGAGYDGRPAPKTAVMADPVLTEALLARSRRLWDMVPHSQRSRREPLSRALEAADYTAAREELRSVAAASRKELGGRAFQSSELPGEFARLERRLDLPDHPEISRLRAGIEETERLKKTGRIARAMESVTALLEEYGDGLVSRTAHHHAFLTPLVHLKVELHKLGLDVYLANADSRDLGFDLRGSGVRDWFLRRRAADRGSVAGTVAPERVAVQKWSDCAMHALWNLPALRPLRSRMTYERFLETAEKSLDSPVRREGLSESGETRLLERLGWRRSYNRTPRGERDLVDAIRNYGGVLGSYDFPMSRWKAFFGIGALHTRFAHGVAVTAAVHDRGRWWFVVLDSGHPYPRVLSYGELLTLGLKIAIVTPAPAGTPALL